MVNAGPWRTVGLWVRFLKALERGHLYGIALDVYDLEPSSKSTVVSHSRVDAMLHIAAKAL